jgi:hypothetical protein
MRVKEFLAIAWAVLVFLSIAVCCHPTKGSQDAPTDDELLQTVDHMQSLAHEALDSLNAEKVAHAQTKIALDRAEVEVTTVTTNFDQYKQHVQETVDKANAAIAAHDHLVKQLHRAKFLACGLIAAVAAFIVFKVGGKIGLIAGGVLGVGGIAAIWAWL